MQSLIAEAQNTLKDLKCILEQETSNNYIKPISELSGGTIGQHTRHIIEFFQCLLNQINSGTINYCKRARNKAIENSMETAIQAIDEINYRITCLCDSIPLNLETTMQGDQQLSSNTKRELLYVTEHCIHHLAIIRIGLNLINTQVAIPQHFGVAPATIANRQNA